MGAAKKIEWKDNYIPKTDKEGWLVVMATPPYCGLYFKRGDEVKLNDHIAYHVFYADGSCLMAVAKESEYYDVCVNSVWKRRIDKYGIVWLYNDKHEIMPSVGRMINYIFRRELLRRAPDLRKEWEKEGVYCD